MTLLSDFDRAVQKAKEHDRQPDPDGRIARYEARNHALRISAYDKTGFVEVDHFTELEYRLAFEGAIKCTLVHDARLNRVRSVVQVLRPVTEDEMKAEVAEIRRPRALSLD